jgi:hypothetical protein
MPLDDFWGAAAADWQGGEFTADSTSHVSVYRVGPAE